MALDDVFLELQELIVAQASPLQIFTGQEPSGPAKRRGIDPSRRILPTANRNHDAMQVKALTSILCSESPQTL